MKKFKIIISGGGTGGHIFPAVSIANAFTKRFPSAEILFVGALGRMEMEKVPAAGYSIIGLPVYGFDRKRLWRNFSVVYHLLRSLIKAKRIIRDFQPDIAVGVGGYASGPLLKMASRSGLPIVIQEQNSFPGITNKLLAQKASAICVAYSGLERFFPKDRIILTGNPIRQNLGNPTLDRDKIYEAFQLDKHKKTILIVGGSLGARTINEAVKKALPEMRDSETQFIWQTGRYYFKEMLEAIEDYKEHNLCVKDFIAQMDWAYFIADLVISRAGAGSISELCMLGKPTILVPSPNVAEDHQTKNAMALVERDAAILIPDKKAVKDLIPTALQIVHNEQKLNNLSIQIAQLAEHDSAERIVDEIVKQIR